jgi:acyl-CoA synthetase (AMP-forming)/AMP-acid ligase II
MIMGQNLKLRLEDIINNGAAAGFYQDGSFVDGKSFSCLVKGLYEKARAHPSERVILYCDDSYLFFGAFLALLAAEKTVIMPTTYRSTLAEELSIQLVFSDREGLNDKVYADLDVPAISEDRELFFYTSGSTAEPKLVRKRFANLMAEAVYLSKLFKPALDKEPIFVSTVNVGHMYGIFYAFLMPLLNGLVIDTATVRIPEHLSALCEKYGKVFLASSPAFLDRVAGYKDEYKFNPPPLEISTAGGVLKNVAGVKELFGIWPMEIYGSTETGGIAHKKNNEVWALYEPVNARATDGGIAISGGLVDEEYTLPDVAEFSDDRHFMLKGRSDRLVKIAEKRVSLPELETKILAVGGISAVRTLLLKNEHIGAAVTLTPDGKERLIKDGKQAFVSAIKHTLAQDLDPVAIPSRWRILEELPVNAQGKVLAAEIGNEFASNLAEPVVFKKEISEDSAVLELAFVKDAIYFRGHFPGFPILPGVTQIHFVVYWARKYLLPDLQPKRITRLKFSNILTPSENCTLSLVRKDNKVSFRYYKGDKTYSSGELHV